jgi:hypothetical protein
MQGVLDIDESTDVQNPWEQFADYVELLRGQFLGEVREPGYVSAGVRQTLDQSESDWIRAIRHYNWDCTSRLVHREVGGHGRDTITLGLSRTNSAAKAGS